MKIAIYRLLANIAAFIHLAWGLWGIVGCVLAINGYYAKHPISWIIYLLAMISNGLYLKFFTHCPLTILERKARIKYNPKAKILDKFSTYWIERITGRKTTPIIVWIFLWTIYFCNLLVLFYWSFK